VLITDGEEAGLLGARAFFASDDPVLGHIGEVVNLEARGGGGRVNMFQTGARDGGHIALFRRAVADSNANSVTSEVYKSMPNDTDFTVSRNKGLPGFNFAFIGEEFDYHSPSSTPDALDQGALQHMGAQALFVVRALADSEDLPKASADAAYSDLLGHGVIAYPAVVGGWLILALSLSIAGLAVWRGQRLDGERPPRLGALAWSAFGTLIVASLVGVVLWAAGQLVGLGDFVRHRALLADYPAFFGGFALLAVGGALLLLGPVQPGRTWTLLVAVKETRWSGWAGSYLVLALLSLLLQVFFPPMAILTEWPLLAAALTMAATAGFGGRFEHWGAVASAGLVGLIAVAHLGHFADQTFTAVGEMAPELLALFVLVAIPVLFPLLAGWGRGGWRAQLAAVTITVVGAGVIAYGGLHSPWTPRTPQAVQAFFLQDSAAGRSWRASALDTLDPWSAAALGAGQVKPIRQEVPALNAKLWLTPAPKVSEPTPVFTSSRDGDAVIVHITPKAGGRELRMSLTSTVPVSALTLDGKAAPLLDKAGEASYLRWSAAGDGLTLRFIPAGPGQLDLKYAEIKDGWPAGMAPPPKPANMMPWGLSDTTVVLAELKTRW